MLFRLFTLLAVIALAASTWILSSPSHRPQFTATTGSVDLPGYYLKNAVLTDYDVNGIPTMHLEAERIDQIAHSSEVELSKVRVDYRAPNGQTWLLFGDSGRVEPGGKIIDVKGNVRLQGESTAHTAETVILTDTLSYNVPDTIATTKSEVRVQFGVHSLSAHSLIANLKERTLHLEKVNGQFQR